MAIENYIAAAGLGLFIMFAMEVITVYNFIQDEPAQTTSFILEPDPKLLQFISIGAAPAVIMVGVSFMISKRHGSKKTGWMTISGGAIMLAGMIYAHSLIEGIHPMYESDFIPFLTPLFMVVSIPVMVVGIKLLMHKHRGRISSSLNVD